MVNVATAVSRSVLVNRVELTARRHVDLMRVGSATCC
ncbi:putative leader peptide [Frankia tisae]